MVLPFAQLLLTEQFPFTIVKAKEQLRMALGTPEAKQATANHSWHELCSSRLTLSAPLALAAATEMAL